MLKQEQHSSTGSAPPHVVAAAAPDALTAHKHRLTIVKSFTLLSMLSEAYGCSC